MFRTFVAAPNTFRCIRQTYRPPHHPPIIIRGLRTTIPKPNSPGPVRYKRFLDQGKTENESFSWRRLDPRVKLGITFLVLGGYYVANLEQVPETGRWRFMILSEKFEAQLGEMVNQQTRRELGNRILPPDHPISVHVRQVASRIIQHSDLGYVRGEPSPHQSFGDGWVLEDDFSRSERKPYGRHREWDVIVVNDNKVINAAANPGLIMVFTGILPICQDQQGLAAVLSHEIGHVVARHSFERIVSSFVSTIAVIILAGLGIPLEASDLAQRYLLELPNSRTQELEADLIGLRLLSRACYDPKAVPEMFERLGSIEAKMGPRRADFFETHPSSERRVQQLKEALPEAYSILAANPECERTKGFFDRFRDRARRIRINDDGSVEY
ncbi:Mitochondrial metalloendopeptidase OMA1 [Leucoagaricus sp. SymC.cos]|nr:Mitochondrial metalloendopeptidase OMA1 [Leucoagaricus sp. SymC.cos]